MRIGSLFTGFGGLDQAVEEVFDARTVWTSDIDPGVCKIIAYRYPDAPNLGDITTIDWSAVEPVDILTGGFPCQDLSLAGKRAGLKPGTRSGLWEHMAYAIDQLRPRYVIAENVRGLLSAEAHSDVEPCPWCLGDGSDGHLRALGAVLGDLASLGYDAQWCGLRAADVGAPHGRFRVFIVATDTQHAQLERVGSSPGFRRGHDARIDLRPVLLPTPTRRDHKGHNQRRDGTCLTGALLPTPRATDGTNLLPTPTVVDSRGGRNATAGRSPGAKFSLGWTLSDVAYADRFGQYGEAVARWTPIIGRTPPDPTVNGRLNPRFVEWMQGCDDGWVTDVPGLSRAEQLKALGNGVVKQQAVAALTHMLALEVAA